MGEDRFGQLRQKYHSVLNAIEQQHARILEMRMERGKLLLRVIAPTVAAKDHIWDQIHLIDRDHDDLTAEIVIAAAAAPPMPDAGTELPEYEEAANRVAQMRSEAGMRDYVVQPGDTLKKLAEDFYGDPKMYTRILYANRDQLRDAGDIRPGQRLKIPDEPLL